MKYGKYYWVLLFIFICRFGFSQNEPIIVSGKVTDCKGRPGIYQTVVLNQRTSSGMLIGTSGNFTINALKNDTLRINAPGFIVKKLCFHDSVFRNKYEVQIRLDSAHIELAEVDVVALRNLKEIKEEEKTLGVIPNTDLNKTCDTSLVLLQLLTLSVDIDGLYEKWSHKEREKRRVARLENEELKRNILKDLLKLYRMKNLLNVEDEQMDKFIDFCNFTDGFIKTTSDADLEMTIKNKYAEFEKTPAFSASNQK